MLTQGINACDTAYDARNANHHSAICCIKWQTWLYVHTSVLGMVAHCPTPPPLPPFPLAPALENVPTIQENSGKQHGTLCGRYHLLGTQTMVCAYMSVYMDMVLFKYLCMYMYKYMDVYVHMYMYMYL